MSERAYKLAHFPQFLLFLRQDQPHIGFVFEQVLLIFNHHPVHIVIVPLLDIFNVEQLFLFFLERGLFLVVLNLKFLDVSRHLPNPFSFESHELEGFGVLGEHDL